MQTRDPVEWLLREGGPVIRYRTAVELAGETGPAAHDRLAQAVLQSEKTQWLLQQMDRFGPITHVDIRVLNGLHGMKPTCLENVVPRLLERGLRAGVAAFDAKMGRFRQYVDNPLVRAVIDDPERATVEGGRAVFVAIVMASYFVRAGYQFGEILRFVEHRIGLLARLAQERVYNVHLTEAELGELPKQWAGKPIIRPEMEPTTGTRPLPLVHDLFAFACLRPGHLSEEARRKLASIVAYVLDERYASLPWGYGYLWSKQNRTCYGCGWSLDLPDLDSADRRQQCRVVQRMELLARLPDGPASAWFQKGLRLLESFRTDRGTYRFPPAYLPEQKDGYYIGGAYMGLEDGRRNATALELESTFRMLALRRLTSGTA